MSEATLYVDLGSPYAYLAAERVDSLFHQPVDIQPVLLGAIFKRRGWGSWAATEARGDGMNEIEDRARRYGLPPIVWPANWPANALAADRAALWARRQNRGPDFIRVLYRRQFLHGADITRLEVIEAAAEEVGLHGHALLEAIQRQEVKELLRKATDDAWERGVRGVPSILVAGSVFYGDDQLEEAAASVTG